MENFEKILRETHLQEKLVPASMNELSNVMSVDKDLENFLNLKAEQLPEEYLFLIQELTEDDKEKTLLNVIQTSLSWRLRGTELKCFFSKAGDKIIGFVAYIVRGNEVIEIKMFSFDPNNQNQFLIRDLNGLLINLLQQYEKVSWSALDNNSANSIYEKTINELGGYSKIENRMVFYCVERQK